MLVSRTALSLDKARRVRSGGASIKQMVQKEKESITQQTKIVHVHTKSKRRLETDSKFITHIQVHT
jgi:hypothetical protein